jgi:hypothetical protein
MLGGRRTGFPTTVVTTLDKGLQALRRLHPKVVLLADVGAHKVDDRLMLLRTLLLLEEKRSWNTLALLYDLTDGRLTLYHNVHLPRVSPEDVAQAVVETVACPLFGPADETRFPQDCRFLPLMAKSVALAAGGDSPSSPPVFGERKGEGDRAILQRHSDRGSQHWRT